MTERPILFSAPMVRSILAGTKSQTRRVVKKLPLHLNRETNQIEVDDANIENGRFEKLIACPYGQPGDRLWVRETWKSSANVRPPISEPYIYAADLGPTGVTKWAATWKPSIHMPRAASRITLEVTSVRVERLQDISRGDAMAEGIVRQPDGGYGLADTTHYHHTYPSQSYLSLWEAINGEGSVEANPWVWVVEFRSVDVAAK